MIPGIIPVHNRAIILVRGGRCLVALEARVAAPEAALTVKGAQS